ncbi:MAG: hypothetical protein NTU53_23165 [Planctomycetota bacterium]|nr:hypothetical protein [Planctomycetota bacterium]
MFPALLPGQAIFRESQGNWAYPFLIQTDFIPHGRNIANIVADPHPWTPAADLDQLPDVWDAIKKLKDDHLRDSFRRAKEGVYKPQIPKRAHQLLHAIATNPWAPGRVLWQATGTVPPPAVQKGVRHALATLGLAESVEGRLGSANVLVYRLTQAGATFLGCAPPSHQGRGEILHQHICHWIELCAKHEHREAHCEFTLPGGYATDVVWRAEDHLWDAFEVCDSATDNLSSHLQKLRACCAVRKITIVCLQKRFLQDLQRKLQDDPVVCDLGQRLTWALAEPYLRKAFR